MSQTNYHFIRPDDHAYIQLISQWYLNEWNMPFDKTKERIKNFSPTEFQVLLLHEGIPIATGGVYHRVGLVEREPRFAVYPHWLALVYTVPEKRGEGLGAMLCTYIEEQARQKGIKEIHLFTHTAETLYQRLNWQPIERLEAGGKNIVVMKKALI